jgi:catechol 2,3-dioxygenase-like lactoylglutathione lyase family enzyme
MVMPSKMHHIGIEVRDIEQSEAFYVGVLGFTKTAEHSLGEGGRKIVFLDLGGVSVELLSVPGNTAYLEAPGEQCGYKHLALLTADVDGDVARAREGGFAVRMEPTDIPTVSARIAFVEDPDGIPVELWQNLA